MGVPVGVRVGVRVGGLTRVQVGGLLSHHCVCGRIFCVCVLCGVAMVSSVVCAGICGRVCCVEWQAECRVFIH